MCESWEDWGITPWCEWGYECVTAGRTGGSLPGVSVRGLGGLGGALPGKADQRWFQRSQEEAAAGRGQGVPGALCAQASLRGGGEPGWFTAGVPGAP